MNNFKGALLYLFLSASTTSYANVVGTDAQNFNPTTSGLDYVTVQSSSTLKPGIINLGYFLNYAVNSLPYLYTHGSNPQSRTAVNDTLLYQDINMGYGLTEGWDVGVSFPVLLDQYIEQKTQFGRFDNQGITEVRFNTKYLFLDYKAWSFATVFSVGFNRIGNNAFLGKDGGPVFNYELIADRKLGRANLALNIGYRQRNAGSPIDGYVIEPLSDQWIGSLALSYLPQNWDVKWIGEIYGSYPSGSSKTSTDRELSSLEALLGMKYDWTTQVALHAGAGTELSQGTATPDWRVYAGLNWSFGPNVHGQIYEFIKGEDQSEKLVASNIQFEFNSAKIAPESIPAVRQIGEAIRSAGRVNKIVIEGHTDSVGKASYNMKLSLERAQAIRAFLIEHYNVDSGKIEAVGFGEERPVADNGNYQGRSANRRVEVKIFR